MNEQDSKKSDINWNAVSSLALGVVGVAIWPVSMVLFPHSFESIFAASAICVLSGISLGIVALADAVCGRLWRRGTSLAILGIIICVLAVLAAPLVLMPRPPVGALCLNNLKQQGAALMLYAGQNNGRLPSAGHWCDTILPLCRHPWQDSQDRALKVFTCPALSDDEKGGYALNSALAVDRLAGLKPSRTIMVFESDPGWNLSGGREKLSKHPRHFDGVTLLFADGHVRWAKKSEAQTSHRLLWSVPNTNKRR